ncbi:hypothetical protein APSETT444_001033 [Aspergillus pseudonomiae]
MARNSTIDEVTFVTILWVCLTISFFFVIVRLALQYRINRKWHTSDFMILVAWLLSLGNAIAWSSMYKQMYQVISLSKSSTTIDFSKVPPNIAWMQKRYLNGQLSAYLLSFTGLWLIKLSFVFFFRQLGNRYRTQKILWWVVLVLVIACYGGTLGCLDYKCEMSSLEYSIGQLPYPPAARPTRAANNGIGRGLRKCWCDALPTGEAECGYHSGHCIGRSQYVEPFLANYDRS